MGRIINRWLGCRFHRANSWLCAFILALFLHPDGLSASPWSDDWARSKMPSVSWAGVKLSADGRTLLGVAYNEIDPFRPAWSQDLVISRDSGRSWTWTGADQRLGSPSLELLAINGDATRLLVGTSGLIWLSEDQGEQWRVLWPPAETIDPPSSPPIRASALPRNAKRFVLLSDTALLTLEDKVPKWISSPLPALEVVESQEGPTGFQLLEVSADGQTVIVASHFPAVCIRSTDAGTHWRTIWQDARPIGLLRGITLSADGQRIAVVHATTERESVMQVSISSDGGDSWRLTSPLEPTYGWASPVAMSDDGSRLLIGSDRQLDLRGDFGIPPRPVIFSADGGATWESTTRVIGSSTDLSADGSIQVATSPDTGQYVWLNGASLPPSILRSDRSGDLGLNVDLGVEFSVTAVGRDLNYQWLKDGQEVTDASNRTGSRSPILRLSPVSEEDLGIYSVRVSNALDSIEVTAGPLTPPITHPFIISTNRVGSPVLVEGAKVTFSVEAAGGLLQYQWRRNGQNLVEDGRHAGTRSPELSLVVGAEDVGTLSVLVTNPIGQVESIVSRTDRSKPILLGFEANVGPIAPAGEPVRLRVRAEGGQLAIRWFRNGVHLDASTAGYRASTNDLEIPHLAAELCGRYTATISNQFGQIETASITVALSSWRRAAVPSDSGWHSAGITADGSRLIASSIRRLMTSADGGLHWKEHSSTNSVLTTACVAAQGDVVFVGRSPYDASPMVASSVTSDWQPRIVPVWNGDFGITYMEPESPHSVACSQDGQIVTTTPKQTYTDFPFSYGMKFAGYLHHSTDGGTTWRSPFEASEGDPENPIPAPIGNGHAWFSLSMSQDGSKQVARHSGRAEDAFLSTDAGATWNQLRTPFLVKSSPIALSPDGSTLAVGALNGVHLSTDLGRTWTKTKAPDKVWTRICLSADGRRMFAVELNSAPFGTGVIYQSMDGGETWQWSGSPSAHWTSLACSATGDHLIGTADALSSGALEGGVFLSPTVSEDGRAISLPATARVLADRIRIEWQGQPDRTYQVLQSDQLNPPSWRHLGAVVADREGHISITDPGHQAHSFWRAIEVQ